MLFRDASFLETWFEVGLVEGEGFIFIYTLLLSYLPVIDWYPSRVLHLRSRQELDSLLQGTAALISDVIMLSCTTPSSS